MILEEREKAWKDRARLKFATQKGKAEGRNEQKIEIAKKMLMKNKDISEIMEFTDLSEEEIQKLR